LKPAADPGARTARRSAPPKWKEKRRRPPRGNDGDPRFLSSRRPWFVTGAMAAHLAAPSRNRRGPAPDGGDCRRRPWSDRRRVCGPSGSSSGHWRMVHPLVVGASRRPAASDRGSYSWAGRARARSPLSRFLHGAGNGPLDDRQRQPCPLGDLRAGRLRGWRRRHSRRGRRRATAGPHRRCSSAS